MKINNQIIKSINDDLMENFDSKDIIKSKELTLLDILALINTIKIRGKS